MRLFSAASILLLSLAVAGCGAANPAQDLRSAQPKGTLEAESHPGWGKKTWTTMVVPTEVMAHVSAAAEDADRRFAEEYRGNPSFRLFYQVGLIASQDGFKTAARAGTPGLKPSRVPHALEFNLGNVPPGDYEYYLTVTASVHEYSGGQFRQVWKHYGPYYVSNYGRNFRASALR